MVNPSAPPSNGSPFIGSGTWANEKLSNDQASVAPANGMMSMNRASSPASNVKPTKSVGCPVVNVNVSMTVVPVVSRMLSVPDVKMPVLSTANAFTVVGKTIRSVPRV